MQAMKGGKGKHEKLKENMLKEVSNCDPKKQVMVEFGKHEEDCVENCDCLNIEVLRKGNQNCRVEIKWEVISDDAIEGEHFSLDITSLVIEKGISNTNIPVTIVDDHDKNPDRHFSMKITEVNVIDDSGIEPLIGDSKLTRITILDDDIPGYFEFSAPN